MHPDGGSRMVRTAENELGRSDVFIRYNDDVENRVIPTFHSRSGRVI